jgi:hypothetical protein
MGEIRIPVGRLLLVILIAAAAAVAAELPALRRYLKIEAM